MADNHYYIIRFANDAKICYRERKERIKQKEEYWSRRISFRFVSSSAFTKKKRKKNKANTRAHKGYKKWFVYGEEAELFINRVHIL